MIKPSVRTTMKRVKVEIIPITETGDRRLRGRKIVGRMIARPMALKMAGERW